MSALLHETAIDLPGPIRERSVNLLNQQLAGAIDLHLQSRHAQWNVSGPLFLALHLFCDQIAKQVEEAVGEIAKRIAQLGGMALGTGQTVMERSRLPEYSLCISSDDQHIAALCRSLASFAASVWEAAATICDDEDHDSIGVLTHAWQTTDKLLWMVQSYLRRRRPEIGEIESSHTSAYEERGKAA